MAILIELKQYLFDIFNINIYKYKYIYVPTKNNVPQVLYATVRGIATLYFHLDVNRLV